MAALFAICAAAPGIASAALTFDPINQQIAGSNFLVTCDTGNFAGYYTSAGVFVDYNTCAGGGSNFRILTPGDYTFAESMDVYFAESNNDEVSAPGYVTEAGYTITTAPPGTFTPLVVDLGLNDLLSASMQQAANLAAPFGAPLALVFGFILFAIGVNLAIGWIKRIGKSKADGYGYDEKGNIDTEYLLTENDGKIEIAGARKIDE